MAAKPRQRLSAVERRSLIVEASQKVFIEEGFAGARTRVIAQEAGITEAILYQHFASKEDLFETAVLLPVQDRSVALAERLRTSLRAAEEGGEEDREVLLRDAHRLVLEGLTDILPLLGVAILADRREATADYRMNLYTAMAEVLSDVGRDLSPVRGVADDPLLLTLLAMSLGPVLHAHFRGATLDVDAVSRQTATMLVYGLSKPPRRSDTAAARRVRSTA